MYILRIPFELEMDIGNDPDSLSKIEIKTTLAIESLYFCESLFFTVRQLGEMTQTEAVHFSQAQMGEALERIGRLGVALSKAAGEQVERIARLPVDAGEATSRSE